MANRTLYTYSVEKEVELGETYIYVTPTSTPGYIQDDFDDGVSYIETWDVQPFDVDEIHPSYDSAYDAVGNGTAAGNLLDYAISSYSSLDYAASYLVGWGATITTRIANIRPVIVFEFDDGSWVKYEITSFDFETGDMDLELVEAEDAAGNPIYEDGDDYAGDDGNPVTFTEPMADFFQDHNIDMYNTNNQLITDLSTYFSSCVQ